jgi:hypothetical protein
MFIEDADALPVSQSTYVAIIVVGYGAVRDCLEICQDALTELLEVPTSIA